jgi:signal transduction histidine kinase
MAFEQLESAWPVHGNVLVENGTIYASVTDDGPGILPKDRERVFERFVRTDSSRGSPGNGLGLTLAKAIAEMHGASIVIEDSEIGTAFLVAFQA